MSGSVPAPWRWHRGFILILNQRDLGKRSLPPQHPSVDIFVPKSQCCWSFLIFKKNTWLWHSTHEHLYFINIEIKYFSPSNLWIILMPKGTWPGLEDSWMKLNRLDTCFQSVNHSLPLGRYGWQMKRHFRGQHISVSLKASQCRFVIWERNTTSLDCTVGEVSRPFCIKIKGCAFYWLFMIYS